MNNPFKKITEPVKTASTLAVFACVIAIAALLAAVTRAR